MDENAKGITSFYLDVDLDNDDKVSMIIAEFGFKGEFIFIKLLSYIYKNKGYYTKWDEMEQLKFAKRVSYAGASANLINEIVDRCIKWELFDKHLFDMFNILTSSRIQASYLIATRKRKGVVLNQKYVVKKRTSDLEAEEIPKKAEDLAKTAEFLDNNKVIESNRIEREKKDDTPPIEIENNVIPVLPYVLPAHAPPEQQVLEFFYQQGLRGEEWKKFYDYYDGLGWKKGISNILNWHAFANRWIAEERIKTKPQQNLSEYERQRLLAEQRAEARKNRH